MCAQDSMTEISRIKTLLKEALFDVEIALAKEHEAPKRSC